MFSLSHMLILLGYTMLVFVYSYRAGQQNGYINGYKQGCSDTADRLVGPRLECDNDEGN